MVTSPGYKYRPFKIVHFDPIGDSDNAFIEGKHTEIPTSFHISRQAFDKMVEKGWNYTVLKEFKYKLGEFQYRLP